MSAIYSRDCDCQMIPGFGVPGFMLEVFRTDDGACSAWLARAATARAAMHGNRPHYERYFAVHGPGGHVIGVRP